MSDQIGKTTRPGVASLLVTLSRIFFILAIVGIAVLLTVDFFHHYDFTLLHERLDSWPLIMAGLSYVTLQLARRRKLGDRIKGIALGLAFVLWGGEQLLPPSRLVTVMDEGAVTIFVVDVSLIIRQHLSNTAEGNGS
jgi:hypothetical protein